MAATDEDAAHGATIVESPIDIVAVDGYRLGGALFARADLADPADAVVFNAGGGLSYLRYRHFLRHLAAAGCAVLAYDYRGVGRSRPARWRGFDAGIEDWSEFDQAGAISALQARFASARLATVSHSVGCMVAATAPNAPALHQMVFIAPHTGYWGDYLQPWRLPMALLWHGVMPVTARIFGYFPAARLGLGDDLPRRVALQWASRRTPDYRPGAAGGNRARESDALDRMARLTVPALAISMADDAFAPEIAVRRFLMGLPNAPVVRRVVGAHKEATPVGHFGFFRRTHQRHWTIVSRFLRSNGVADGIASGKTSGSVPIQSPDASHVKRRRGGMPPNR